LESRVVESDDSRPWRKTEEREIAKKNKIELEWNDLRFEEEIDGGNNRRRWCFAVVDQELR
jgi:hypothetical protein